MYRQIFTNGENSDTKGNSSAIAILAKKYFIALFL
jgi:hypothetical protein